MNDWGMSVLSQYPVTVRTTRKVRGALLCDTKEGLYLLSEYRGKQARLEAEAALLLYLAENGMVHTDQIITCAFFIFRKNCSLKMKKAQVMC